MPTQLNQNIKKVEAVPIQIITATINGSAIDTYLADGSAFDTVLAMIEIGDLGDQTSTKVKIEEDDDNGFGNASVAEGGEEITVAADNSYKMEVARKKRYLRAVITITGGATPSAEVCIPIILWNVAKPFPML